jgi:hypothetical protein
MPRRESTPTAASVRVPGRVAASMASGMAMSQATSTAQRASATVEGHTAATSEKAVRSRCTKDGPMPREEVAQEADVLDRQRVVEVEGRPQREAIGGGGGLVEEDVRGVARERVDGDEAERGDREHGERPRPDASEQKRQRAHGTAGAQ